MICLILVIKIIISHKVTVEIIHFSILMETDEPDVYYGVHSWATYNSKYLKLLEDKKISGLSTLSLIKDFKEFVNYHLEFLA